MYVVQRVSCHVTVEYELVRKYQMAGGGTHRGTPLGKMPQLWPFDLLRRPLVAEAEEFVRQIGTHGYEPRTSIYEFKVWGPYTEKVGEPSDWKPEEGNHMIPKHQQRTAAKVWGYREDELSVELGCAFFVQGEFSIPASRGHVEEERGVLIVG